LSLPNLDKQSQEGHGFKTVIVTSLIYV